MADNEEVPPMSYAERLRGRSDADVERQQQERKDHKVRVAASIDRLNTLRGGTLAERLAISRARDQRIAQEQADAEEQRAAEQARISARLKRRAERIQDELGLGYPQRLAAITPPANISTKDLRSPSERARDEEARRDSLESGDWFAE